MPMQFVIQFFHPPIFHSPSPLSAFILPEQPFFSLLENIAEKGKSIQGYLSVFDTKSSQELVGKFRPRTNPDILLNGHSMLVETAGSRRMVTILSRVQGT
jgi:hypothetical protein